MPEDDEIEYRVTHTFTYRVFARSAQQAIDAVWDAVGEGNQGLLDEVGDGLGELAATPYVAREGEAKR